MKSLPLFNKNCQPHLGMSRPWNEESTATATATGSRTGTATSTDSTTVLLLLIRIWDGKKFTGMGWIWQKIPRMG